MTAFLKLLAKLPYWIIALVSGVVLIALPCVTINKDYTWTTHPPNPLLLAVVGIALVTLSVASYCLFYWSNTRLESAGLDLSRVREKNGVFSTTVSGCEIRVMTGRIEDLARQQGVAVVLPCNEYFDDRCIADPQSALGAYVGRIFEGQAEALTALVKEECQKKLIHGTEEQKTDEERAFSFGPGKCVLLTNPLGRSVPLALVSTTTQRSGQGLAARISYLFEGMQQLVTRLADARLNEVVMPILGAGHGRIDSSMAFVGLVLAVAEAARYGQGGQRLRAVTIVVFKKDAATGAVVDNTVIRRALALVASDT